MYILTYNAYEGRHSDVNIVILVESKSISDGKSELTIAQPFPPPLLPFSFLIMFATRAMCRMARSAAKHSTPTQTAKHARTMHGQFKHTRNLRAAGTRDASCSHSLARYVVCLIVASAASSSATCTPLARSSSSSLNVASFSTVSFFTLTQLVNTAVGQGSVRARGDRERGGQQGIATRGAPL